MLFSGGYVEILLPSVEVLERLVMGLRLRLLDLGS